MYVNVEAFATFAREEGLKFILFTALHVRFSFESTCIFLFRIKMFSTNHFIYTIAGKTIEIISYAIIIRTFDKLGIILIFMIF